MALVVKNLPANTGDIRDMGSIPGLWRFPGGGHGNPRQYSYLENPMDRGTLWAKVHRVTKSWTRLSNWTELKRSVWDWIVVLVVKNLPANTGDIRKISSIPVSGRSPGGGHGNLLQYSCLENPMDRRAWRAAIHGVSKSQTRLKWLSMWLYRLSMWLYQGQYSSCYV